MHNYKCIKPHSVKGEQPVFTPILQQIFEALGNRYFIREWHKPGFHNSNSWPASLMHGGCKKQLSVTVFASNLQ